MGGDHGPAVMLAGAAIAYQRRDDLSFLLFGDEDEIARELAARPGLAAVSEIVHCPETIGGGDRPSQGIRRAKTTSMGRMIAALKESQAQAAGSRGKTRARMGVAELALRPLPRLHP